MIKGKRVILVPFDKSHWSDIQKWMYDDYYKFYFKNMPEMLNPEQLGDFQRIMGLNILMIYDRGQYEASLIHGFCALPVGLVSWDNVRLLARTCDFGIVIDKDKSGQHYGAEASILLINYLFNRLGFHKICVATAEEAELTAEKAMKRLGFQFEGSARHHFYVDGEWKNEKRFSLLKEEFHQACDEYMKGDSDGKE